MNSGRKNTLNVADKLFFCGTGYQGFSVLTQSAPIWACFCNVSKLIGLGGFCLLTAFAFFTAQSHGGANSFADKIHQAGDNTFIRVDASAR